MINKAVHSLAAAYQEYAMDPSSDRRLRVLGYSVELVTLIAQVQRT
jgi:hypothetical protein